MFLKNLSVARKARVGRHQPRVNFSSIFEAKLDDRGGDCGRGAGAIRPHVYAVQGTNDPHIALATSEEALAALYAGNKRFVTGQVNAAYRDMDRVKAIAPKSTPFAAFLGCADSRVPIEMVFDQGFDDLYVTRIAGNVATSKKIGSLEFGTLLLRAKVLFVLGHTSCGAVAATIQAAEVPGQISGLVQHIRPAVRVAKGNLGFAWRRMYVTRLRSFRNRLLSSPAW